MANIKFFKKATRPTSAGVGSVWFDSTRKAIVLTGATEADDVIYSGCITNAVVEGEKLLLTKTDGNVITVDFAVFATDAALNAALTPINNSLDGKQDKTDNTLATTDKTVSGAINEINTKVSNLTGALTWKGKFDTLPAVTDYEAGNVVGVGNKEYVLTVTGSTKAWEELGDEGSYLLKSTAEETYLKKAAGEVATANIADGAVTSTKLNKGARKPIILTPETTEVDEETYQKLLSDDADVIFKDSSEVLNILYDRVITETSITLTFVSVTCSDTDAAGEYFFSYFPVSINKATPHTLDVSGSTEISLEGILNGSGYLNKSTLNPVLQEIDLTGPDADRKAKLDQFEADWKTLTGSSDLAGARFVGAYEYGDNYVDAIFMYDFENLGWAGIAPQTRGSETLTKAYIDSANGSLTITPLFSHLEAITIGIDNTPESKAANVAAIEAYEDNLEALGFDMTKGHMIPITVLGRNGFLSTRSGDYPYAGYVAADSSVNDFYNILILGNGEYYDSKIQSENSNELNTISKKLVPAINEVNTLAKNKQDKLTSGTNIKTINNQSLLGSGNIEISAPSITVDTTISDTSMNPVQNKVIKAYIDGLVGNVEAWIEYE